MFASSAALAQVGAVRHSGYLEYQYRNIAYDDFPSSALHLKTWRTNLSTYVWQPWILQLDGSLGITATNSTRGDAEQDGTLVTGSLTADLFPRSPFPFRAFVDTRDSRVDGDISELDLSTFSYGFLMQFAPRGGGSQSLEYRHADNDEVRSGTSQFPRDFTTDNWQLSVNRAFGRNDFRLLSTLRSVERAGDTDAEDRTTVSLRHRFRTGPRFFIEDTTFYSDERIVIDSMDLNRRFAQFNGLSTWRPDTERPLLVTGRALLQGTDSGSGTDMNGATQAVISGALSWQWTPRATISGNVGFTSAERDTGGDEDGFFQRVRASYRADSTRFMGGTYRWGGTGEAGNLRESDTDNTIQDLGVSFNHGLTHNLDLGDYTQLQFNASQQINAVFDTEDRRDYTMLNSVFATLTRQRGRTRSYVRLSASDRRLLGEREAEFQLVNLQVSTRTQIDRDRSWNGSVTFQFNRNERENGIVEPINSRSTSYSANLSYMQRDLFGIRRLNLLSELRWLSNDFQSEDPFDRQIDVDPERDDRVWRNRVDYRVGRLELRLNADAREVNGAMTAQFYIQARRHYGAL